jgi:23S rRNA (cytosine1962-C5)-methyltransferase
MLDALTSAVDRRRPWLGAWHAEGTDCYRLLHGAVEGAPGLAVDRYGPILLVQTWREPVDPTRLPAMAAAVGAAVGAPLVPVWNHRPPPVDFAAHHPVDLPARPTGRELGVSYDVHPRHRGQDPLLFLDLRALRRRVLAHRCARVLNLFSYTGGVGICAARAGAREVWNVDFAVSAGEVAAANALANGVEAAVRTVRDDALALLRRQAGDPSAEPFDLVVLDPPRWSKGPHGAVDVVRDYPALFKPALLATRPGGVVAATNHVPSVDREDWLQVLERCARKAGRPLAAVEWLVPEEDFPSPDGRHPLKIAWCTVS